MKKVYHVMKWEMGVYQIVSRSKCRISRIHNLSRICVSKLYPGYPKCLALDEGPMDVLRLRPCPDHGRFIADVGCSSSLCSASIAQQRLPCILAQ